MKPSAAATVSALRPALSRIRACSTLMFPEVVVISGTLGLPVKAPIGPLFSNSTQGPSGGSVPQRIPGDDGASVKSMLASVSRALVLANRLS